MKKCLVIGGGFAGLSTSVFLSEQNVEVTLLEASPKLGGRAYSILDDNNKDSYDNGQHILMGCYYDTLNFLSKIDALDCLDIQDSLNVTFVKRGGKEYELNSPKYFYPLNLLYSILNYKAVPLKSRLKMVDFFLDLICCDENDLSGITVLQWLKEKKQSDEAIEALWEIITVGALNTTVEKASAKIFAGILKRIFLDGSKAAAIVVPKTGLSELYTQKSSEYILSRGGSINLSERVLKFVTDQNKIRGVVTDRNHYKDFDFVISAVPVYSLEKIFSNSNISTNDFNLPSLEYSPILNIHLRLKQNPFDKKFYGLIGSQFHWLFNHEHHISITTSSAEKIINEPNEKILKDLYSDLEIYFPIFETGFVTDYQIVKERRATFIPDTNSEDAREKVVNKIWNFILAGDWTNTGLPSTIESAVISGRIAAERVIAF